MEIITTKQESTTVRRLNRDQFKKIRRPRGSKNFISKREKIIFNSGTFLDL